MLHSGSQKVHIKKYMNGQGSNFCSFQAISYHFTASPLALGSITLENNEFGFCFVEFLQLSYLFEGTCMHQSFIKKNTIKMILFFVFISTTKQLAWLCAGGLLGEEAQVYLLILMQLKKSFLKMPLFASLSWYHVVQMKSQMVISSAF